MDSTLCVFAKGGEEMDMLLGGVLVLWLITTIIHAKSDEEPDDRTPEERDRDERFWDHMM